MWWRDIVVTGVGVTLADASGARFEPKSVLGPKGLRYKDRASQLGMSAALLALESAGQEIVRAADGTVRNGPLSPDTGVVVSSNRGNLDTVCRAAEVIRDQSAAGTAPMDLPNASPNVVASSIAIRFGLQGPNVMLCSGEGSGLEAVRMGAVLIGSGRAARVVVVGVEPANAAVAALLSIEDADCFDGAAALVLEHRSSARRPLAGITGWQRAGGPAASEGHEHASGARGVLLTVDAVQAIANGSASADVADAGRDGLRLALHREGSAV
ncbi:beta-ketoacyl synthase N-terminal-like domain-containing protein [Glycomyces tritici]|uniref:Beta-ketoacyl synthase N-terminal-like domain-containing protein n=1 Tax=Glycomyces tritici TaxID=2665176 RepID=A0ABT7YYY5_9ACTN|nr:beta-ketoacyl synthase N-terminal-like domain-containing protein [Glycomyces tritici]MDN3243809.1 beta-ketoacyl synthase N-terminal-like domain-containing protein [Glycomyces tritici]